ncbi:MAG: glycosyltransferase family 2 protein [Hyphomicrobiales bacterium]|nr:glycosyltransferase family 2 protein [Hyphomicrobiales bacterium]
MTVSVIIPAYNVASIIGRAIESAAAQSARPLEIIVVDDASTDDTASVVSAMGNRIPGVRLVSCPSNRGPAGARNFGIAAARGDWVALLDSDDAWKPERLERLTAIGEAAHADFVADNQVLYDISEGKEVRMAYAVPWETRPFSVRDLYESGSQDLASFYYGLLKPILRRSFLMETGIRYDETMRTGEDFVLYAELLFQNAKAILVSEAYYIYTLRFSPSTGAKSRHNRSEYDFSQMAQADDRLLEKYGTLVDPPLAKTIKKRRRNLMLIHQANIAREYRRAGEYGRYVWFVATRPALVRRLIERTVKRARTGGRRDRV